MRGLTRSMLAMSWTDVAGVSATAATNVAAGHASMPVRSPDRVRSNWSASNERHGAVESNGGLPACLMTECLRQSDQSEGTPAVTRRGECRRALSERRLTAMRRMNAHAPDSVMPRQKKRDATMTRLLKVPRR